MIMNQFKRAQVILLPTNKSNIVLINPKKEFLIGTETGKSFLQGGKDWIYNSSITDNSSIPQHLYIISDDEIKEGDYFLADNRLSQSSNSGKPNWIVCKCTEVKNTWKYCNEIPNEGHNGDWSKKIIATTDTSLKQFIHTTMVIDEDDMYKSLPQPSQQFITKYIESYNKGEVITDVLVEYFNNSDYNPSILDDIRLKINPKDHTITIKKLKDSWNREEVSNLIKLFANNYQYASNDIGYNKWIEENL